MILTAFRCPFDLECPLLLPPTSIFSLNLPCYFLCTYSPPWFAIRFFLLLASFAAMCVFLFFYLALLGPPACFAVKDDSLFAMVGDILQSCPRFLFSKPASLPRAPRPSGEGITPAFSSYPVAPLIFPGSSCELPVRVLPWQCRLFSLVLVANEGISIALWLDTRVVRLVRAFCGHALPPGPFLGSGADQVLCPRRPHRTRHPHTFQIINLSLRPVSARLIFSSPLFLPISAPPPTSFCLFSLRPLHISALPDSWSPRRPCVKTRSLLLCFCNTGTGVFYSALLFDSFVFPFCPIASTFPSFNPKPPPPPCLFASFLLRFF